MDGCKECEKLGENWRHNWIAFSVFQEDEVQLDGTFSRTDLLHLASHLPEELT